jgi:hypothetical protein
MYRLGQCLSCYRPHMGNRCLWSIMCSPQLHDFQRFLASAYNLLHQWAGLAHCLNHPNETLLIDTSRYSGNTLLLVQQALHEQDRIGWDKAFRGYLSLTWGLLENPHDVPNPYNKNPQPSAWVISTSTSLEISVRPCGKPAARNSMIPITPLLQQPISMQKSLFAMLTPKIFSLPTASCSISLSRKSSNPDALLKQNFFAASAVLIAAS